VSRPLTVNEALSQAKKAMKQHRYDVAGRIYRQVLAQHPGHPVARKGLRKLQKTAPRPVSTNPPQAQVDSLIQLYQSGHMEEVEQSCRELLRLHPGSLIVINLLGTTLQVLGQFEDAVEVFDLALSLKPDFAEAWSNRGNALKELGRLDDSVASYNKAIALKPDFAVASYNRGNALRDSGYVAEAIAAFEKAIEITPDFAAAHRNLSALKRYEIDDPQIEVMQNLWTRSGGGDPDRMEIGYALAKACEDLGDIDRSFAFLSEANGLCKKMLPYNIDTDRKLFAEIKAAFSGSKASASTAIDNDPTVRPIFIVGMMRSGTSLVEQILASHSAVHGGGELELLNRIVGPNFPDVDIKQLRETYISEIAALAPTAPVVTDKMPLNFRWTGYIREAFPEAKIIHLRRDPMAVCWSIYKHYFPAEGNAYANDLDDLAAYYGLYVDLMSFWEERHADYIFDVCYENLTENREEEIRRLLAFCELEWEDQCLEFEKTERAVKTSSAMQVRKKMYTGSSDAWRQFAGHLQPLADKLAS
jgi:tetratricopeptide (TPR) repeat protein